MRIRTLTQTRQVLQVGVFAIRPGRILYFALLSILAYAWVGWPGVAIAFLGGCDYSKPKPELAHAPTREEPWS